jgi:threonyl-tRNA synthetase
MNCPFHVLIYKSRSRSYRELPLRLFELGTVYRYERSGVVHGLLRARGFTQDDSHIFCAVDQIGAELQNLLDFVLMVLRDFGFEEFEAELSTRPEKYVGEIELWDLATAALAKSLETAGLSYDIAEGEGAFYGPKIDVHIKDAIGRKWQLSTIQVDFSTPERFEIEYTSAENTRERPVMIHRALFGSVERFFGILVEHYAGAFPAWLAPVQATIVPVADRHLEYADEVATAIHEAGIRVDVDSTSETVGEKIRRALSLKVPAVLVVGDKDVSAGTVGYRRYEADHEDRGVALEDAIARLKAAVQPPR